MTKTVHKILPGHGRGGGGMGWVGGWGTRGGGGLGGGKVWGWGSRGGGV